MRFSSAPLLACSLAALGVQASLNNDGRRNLKTIRSIYDLTVYPNNLALVQKGSSAVPKGLFAENASGRVDPLGNFTGFDDSVEYFYGFLRRVHPSYEALSKQRQAPLPQPPTYGVFTRADITSFVSGCADVAASVVEFEVSVVNPGAPNNGQHISKLKQVAFWKFDSSGAVLHYDAWITNLQPYIVDYSGGVDPTVVPQVQQAVIQQTCGATQQLCTGANQVYSSVEDCIAKLSAKPYGNYDEVWGDNVVCRTIHLRLAALRPQVHCPHVGPTGGMKCVDYPYEQKWFVDQPLFGDPTGQTFQC
ncbi:MAG: hypothetical protein M1829_002231 [Trizodia sp. TS-e1964]|nr:MAG: hypothetical protein M1829_002231 [Trizodia sp. TS-e1964]